MIEFMKTSRQDVKDDVRLYFATLIGAIKQMKAELHRSNNDNLQMKTTGRKVR